MLKTAIGQINTTACDIAGNLRKQKQSWVDAENRGADIIVFPELSISGYPLDDMAENPDVLSACQTGLTNLLEFSRGKHCAAVVSLPEKVDDKIYNVAYVIEDGKILHRVAKQHLPNMDVFDEKRIFTAGPRSETFDFRGYKIGIAICQDIWMQDVIPDLVAKGAELILSPNASPYYAQKHKHRIDNVLRERIVKEGNAVPILYVNQVGGQDEVVFDGYSTAINSDGSVAYIARNFEEDMHVVAMDRGADGTPRFIANGITHAIDDPLLETWKALVLGTRDYFYKTGFHKANLGMSGGIDSAVVAAIAVDALGPENVRLYKLPSKYSSDHSITDAEAAAELLGVTIEEIPIQTTVDSALDALRPHFNSTADPRAIGLAEENLQARIRGLYLMALSNANGDLLLSTGNKSEVSVGFATLYGDMNGGFNPLKDVYKMNVYALAEMRNTLRPEGSLGPESIVVPGNIIKKKPSAELRPNQTDEQSLPPYPMLDRILHGYIEEGKALNEIISETGYEAGMVRDVLHKVDVAEFKRRQACPGVKVTEKSFGKGRRVPIAKPTLPRMIAAVDSMPHHAPLPAVA